VTNRLKYIRAPAAHLYLLVAYGSDDAMR
jgi:hypothetical protein